MSVKDLLDDLLVFLEDLTVPARALIVAGLGVFLAWLWFNAWTPIVIFVVIAIILLGVLLFALGKSQLPHHPVRGLALMEFYVISPAMFAAVAASAVIVVTVALSPQKNATTDDKELLTSLTTAITAFLTGGFISWTEDKDGSTLAKRIQKAFRSKYKRFDPNQTPEKGVKYFRAESIGERWIESFEVKGVEGWDGKARRKRALGLALEMKSGDSDPE